MKESEDTDNLINEKAPSPVAIIYQSELDYLSRCVLDYPDIETGGQLFGFWNSQGVPVVLYVIGPGQNANHQPSFFNQDKSYLLTVGNELLNRYGLCHIGEWHSHHQLGLSRPSGHDARTMHHGLTGIPQRHLLLCICNYENGFTTVNPYNFHENDLSGYADAVWQVFPMTSPFREIADRELSNLLIHPYTSVPRHGRNRLLGNVTPESQEQPSKIMIPAEYWVSKGNNISVLKEMYKKTCAKLPSWRIDTQADESGIIQFHIEGIDMCIRFSKNFPETCPEIYEGCRPLVSDSTWNKPINDEDILNSYENWLDKFIMSLPHEFCELNDQEDNIIQ